MALPERFAGLLRFTEGSCRLFGIAAAVGGGDGGDGGFAPRATYFSHAGKVGKSALRGDAERPP